MSNSKSNQSSRRAGGSRVYGHGQQADLDLGGFLRRLNKIGNFSTEQIVTRISHFLKECQKNPSLALDYGLTDKDLIKLNEVWGDSTQPKSKEELEKLTKAIDSFLSA